MTIRNPVSAIQNIWFDTEEVDDTDLTLEQQYNNTIESGIIANQVGYGVLPGALVPNTLFNSANVTGFLDGIAIFAQQQPSDKNYGNQLSITLSGSTAGGRRSVKVGVIGLDFNDNLQYETFYFFANETQVGSQHFTQILVLLFNDFIGDPQISLNLGGTIVIQEAQPMTLSRDTIMVAQNQQPNLFFRDFFLDGPASLQALLQNAMPLYNISTLGIYTTQTNQFVLAAGDVTTQIGEKFIATTNNIQQVTLLLSVQNLVVGQENNLAWTGDLVLSIYPLQTAVDCESDLVPGTPIEYPPSNVPVAQVSYNYNSLMANGIVLDSVPQPVPFVFSNSPAGAGTVITPGQYYAIALNRSGAASSCQIIIAAGSNLIENSEVTMFAGDIWVDIPDNQLWFEIETDAAKVSDGQGYENGFGVIIPKTTVDPTTGATVDYSLGNIQFAGGGVFQAVLSAVTDETTPVPDPRTGNPVLTRQQFVPQVELLNVIDLTNLEAASEPLLLGAIQDKNIDYINALSSTIQSNLHTATIVNNEMLIRIVTDPTDTVRYDTTVTALQSELLNGMFVGAQIYPDATNSNIFYRIASASLCSYILGDVDGNGIIDENDLTLLNSFLGYNMNIGLPLNTVFVSDGYTYSNVINGYTTLTQPFVNQFNVQFQLVDANGNIVADGYDGVLVANPNDNRLAQFTSASVAFNTIVGLSSYSLVVVTPSTPQDFGIFTITSLDSVADVVTIQKIFLDGDVMGQLLRANIDGDFVITYNDGYLLNSYIERQPLTQSPVSTFPGPATNPYTNIGTPFNVVRFSLEQFVDRDDDYTNLTVGRAQSIHPVPDIFSADGYFAQHNFYTQPVPIRINQQLSWNEYLVVYNSTPKQVPTVFTYLNGFTQNSCAIDGITCNVYGSQPAFDPGRVDVFVPNNLIIGAGGQVENPDGSYFKVDFEVGSIVLEIPDGLFGSERTIDLMGDFIADYTGTGITRLGFPAMRFADCSTVTAQALANDQLRFSVSVQSFSPNTNGLDPDGYAGIIVDGKMGVAVDYETGLLTLNFTNLYQDAVLQTLSTKVQIDVFLKKGGFNNQTLFVDSTKVQNMLKLISVFSGANDGGPSALVDLASDVTDVLPVIHGGTGLNATGAMGTVLSSTGTGLSYQFIYDLTGVIPFSTGIADANRVPKTDGYGFLDPSFMYKNPVYIPACSGTFSNDTSTPVTVGAFTFRFDSFIMEGWSSINLEVVLETTNPVDIASVQLYNVNTHEYLTLSGVDTSMTTTSTTATLLRSDDLSSQLSPGASDWIYEVQISLSPASGIDSVICKMARLVITYNNLTLNGSASIAPPVGHSYNFVPFLPSPTPM